MSISDLSSLSSCKICPRKCGADRTVSKGFCGCTADIRVAKAYLHQWEEPCISGKNGSGTVFFSGCNLKCCFCQNYKISSENFGKDISIEKLSDIFLSLQDKGAENINLVSPTPYIPHIIKALDITKHKLSIPVVYNTGGYENVESLKALDGYVEIYLPDFKYYSNEMSKKYSGCPDYYEVTCKAINEMFRQVGKIQLDSNEIAKKGVIIRHLVLPCGRNDSIEVLETIKDMFSTDEILLSLMSQYTPFYRSCDFKEINRRISTFEYNYVYKRAVEMGFKGYMQEKSSAKEEYTPDFDLSGI